MLVGEFKYNDEVGLPTGYVRTFTMNYDYVEMHFIPEDKRSERWPICELKAYNMAGQLAPIGSLWERPMADGTPYLAGFVDDHHAGDEKQMAFFGNQTAGYEVQWRRNAPQSNSGNGNQRGGNFQRGGQRQNGGFSGRSSGGFAGGSTAGAGGEYVGGGRQLDDDVPF
ncbi:MAG: DUF736 family protein [Sphingobium sp.]|nr:DUF736 family protein [Sphingobium sp.]